MSRKTKTNAAVAAAAATVATVAVAAPAKRNVRTIAPSAHALALRKKVALQRAASVRYCKATGSRSVDLPTLRAWYAKLNPQQRAVLAADAISYL